MYSVNISNPIEYKVALYIRLSKEDLNKGETKKEESESISNQRSILERFCESNRLCIVDEYIDDGISGTTFNRPAFERMIQDIEAKKVNMVITKDLSRLGRDYIGIGHYLEKYFPENRVRYISVLDGIDTGIDSTSNDITPFKSILNDMYAKDISNKIKSVKHNKQDLGLFIGGKAPFGYKLDKQHPNKLFIDEEAKPIVERIFQEACKGKSCRAIAMDLTLDHIPSASQYAVAHGAKITKISQNWSDTRIREILLNEVYIGNMVQGRIKKINYKSKKTIRLPEEQWKIVENTHEPIIDKTTFLKAKEMIETRKQTRVKTHDYLLKGLVYCHECGKKVGCSPRELAEGKVYYFRCSTYTSYARLKYCTSHSIRMDYVENLVTKKIKEIIQNFKERDKMINITKQKLAEKKNKNKYEKELEDCKNKLSKISLEIDSIYNDKLNGILAQDDFTRIYERKKKEKLQTQDRIDMLKNHLDNSIINEEELIEKLIQKFHDKLTINREILVDLVDKIEIDENKKVYVYFKFKALNDVKMS